MTTAAVLLLAAWWWCWRVWTNPQLRRACDLNEWPEEFQ